MNALLLTVLAVAGADGYGYAQSGGAAAWESYGEGDYCDACGEGGGRHRHGCHGCGKNGALCWSMPQSCYNPSFGCYPSTRFMHRYPAFHNYYTREAYNYRQYFDYPWHAGLHEPTSMFSSHVPGESPVEEEFVPPAPAPEPVSRQSRPAVRSAGYLAPVVQPGAARPRPAQR